MSRRAGDPAAVSELGGRMNTDDPDDVVRYLKEQLAIRDAVIELLEVIRNREGHYEDDFLR